MMLLQSWSLPRVPNIRSQGSLDTTGSRGYRISSGEVYHPFRRRNTKTTIRCFSYETQVAEIFQNKVLIAASASAAIGQLSKPFTSILFNSNSSFDFKAVFEAGGFPSTHSSAVVAAATILGLERGLSDPIFGFAVIAAWLFMYDAQGVRREAGNHAKLLNNVRRETGNHAKVLNNVRRETGNLRRETGNLRRETGNHAKVLNNHANVLNRVFLRNKLNQTSSITDDSYITDSLLGESSNSESHEPLFLETESTARKKTSGVVPGVKRKSESDSVGYTHLKESIGHTEIEVLAGALLGFFVGIAVRIT